MTDAAPMIRVQDLTIGWDDVVLQKNASFDVSRGDVFAILGVSGCGKSTLMRYLVGLETPVQGTVAIDGIVGQRFEVGRPPFGVMFQSGALFGSMTVGENVGLPLSTWTDLEPEAVNAIVRAKLRLVGLRGVEDKLPSELSGGMKKRAAIARAMALEPSLIFLDEPSAGLDPVTAVELDELVLVLNRSLGLTVVVVTHELPSIFKIVSRCIMLDKASQSIIASGAPTELRDSSDDPRVRSFFHRTPEAH
ncbi:MAG: ATP-binding cassette domain-containing protein [Myxococcota bacterium]|nr:ATP-binding cassette domain-containing protein [Myxococcota bacterium]